MYNCSERASSHVEKVLPSLKGEIYDLEKIHDSYHH